MYTHVEIRVDRTRRGRGYLALPRFRKISKPIPNGKDVKKTLGIFSMELGSYVSSCVIADYVLLPHQKDTCGHPRNTYILK